MKRWYLIGWMAVALVTMCVMMARPAEANNKATSDVVSHTKPVMIPFLNKPITEINIQEVNEDERTEENPGTIGQAESGDIGPEQETEGSGNEADGPCDAVSEDSEGLGEPEDDGQLSDNDGWVYYGNCRITHYDDCEVCCGVAGNRTASGEWPTPDYTVASGDDLPFGTEVLINGIVYVVEDRGVEPYQIDIFVSDHETAVMMGMYYTDVYVRYPEEG